MPCGILPGNTTPLAPGAPPQQVRNRAGSSIKRLDASELRVTLGAFGWLGLKEPFVFEAPAEMKPDS